MQSMKQINTLSEVYVDHKAMDNAMLFLKTSMLWIANADLNR